MADAAEDLFQGYGSLVYGLIGVHLVAFLAWIYLLTCSRGAPKQAQD